MQIERCPGATAQLIEANVDTFGFSLSIASFCEFLAFVRTMISDTSDVLLFKNVTSILSKRGIAKYVLIQSTNQYIALTCSEPSQTCLYTTAYGIGRFKY